MRWIRTTLPAALAVAALLMTVLPISAFAAFENTHKNTGDQAWDIVAVAETQVGYKEGTLEGTKFINDNYTKYGVWYENNVQKGGYIRGAWCAMFVSWCAKEAGIPSETVYYHAYCPYGVTWYKERGLFHDSLDKGGAPYTPQRGDIIYFKEARGGASHVGLVRYTEGDTVYTVEGNTDSMDKELGKSGGAYLKYYKLDSTKLLGFATPNYTDSYSTAAERLGTYQMTGDQVNLRLGPSTSYASIGKLSKNELLVVSEVTDSGWGKLTRTDGTVGWSKISDYATYLGHDVLAGSITASHDYVRVTTDKNGRVTLTNPGAVAVTVDLSTYLPVGTATTPYFNLSSTALSGSYSLAFVNTAEGYTMPYDPTVNGLTSTSAAAISQSHTAQILIKTDWKPQNKCQIDSVRITLQPSSSVCLNYAYFADEPNVITSSAFNTRVYDGSDTVVVPDANVNLMSPDSLTIDTDDVAGGYIYDNGTLTVRADSPDGYAVTMTPNVTFAPERLHRLLGAVQSDAAYDIFCTVATQNGDRALSLATDYRYSVGAENNRIPAGEHTNAVNLYTAFNDAYPLPADGQSTVKSITVRLYEAGSLTLSALQLNDTDKTVTFADSITKQEQTTGAPDILAGDVYPDEELDMRDAFVLYQHASGDQPLTDEQVPAADMNSDGEIDMKDAMFLYALVNGD